MVFCWLGLNPSEDFLRRPHAASADHVTRRKASLRDPVVEGGPVVDERKLA